MKTSIVASLALGAALAFTPSVLADSFGYNASGSSVAANFALNTSPTGFTSQITESGAYTAGGDYRTHTRNNGALPSFNPIVSETFSTGLGANPLIVSGDSASLFVNLLYPGNSGNGTRASGDVLVDIGGHELNLLSGHLGGNLNARGGGSGHFYFADRDSYRVSNELSKGNGDLATTTATLAATPEPGSLFLLGTGLLCLALFLFRRSAKHSTGS